MHLYRSAAAVADQLVTQKGCCSATCSFDHSWHKQTSQPQYIYLHFTSTLLDTALVKEEAC